MQSSVGQPDFGVDKHRALHNKQAEDISVVADNSSGNLRMFGALNALVGGAPPAIAPGLFKIQAGTSVQTTSVGGDVRINFPVAFPSGLLSATAVLGTVQPFYVVVWDTPTTTYIDVRTYDAAGNPVIGFLLRWNWIAIGW